ncbi:MAG TPA: YbaK/EbsC family protein [Bryobacteraceae bacterium]|nr:YbaK/EbsC family protein [Bryobacteraceae bacterium]
MSIVSRWLEYLDRNGIRYSHSVHPPAQTALETARAERIEPHDLVKSVIYFCDTGFGMAVVAADDMVDLPEIGRLLGIEFIRLADEGEIGALFPDCELGAMPPFGNLYGMPVLVDADVAEREYIAFAIGTHRDVARISMADYAKVASPLIAPIVATQGFLV